MNSLIDSVRAAIASEVGYYETVERVSTSPLVIPYAHACALYICAFTDIGDHNAIAVARLLLQWHHAMVDVEKDNKALPPHAPWAVILAQNRQLCENDEHGSRPSPANQVSDEFAALVARRVAKKAVKHTTSLSDPETTDEEDKEAKEIYEMSMQTWVTLGEPTPSPPNADIVNK